ncbi:MAG: hypothetical protein J6L91_03000 [Clostridia bacterium]|nr:hypothetical protein [Clostridia bacterium]
MSERIQPTACPYCGQLVTVVIPDDEKYSEADLNRMATLECSCPAGRQQRAIRDQIEEAKKNLFMLSSDGAQNMGFEPIGDSAVIEMLEKTIELAGYGKVLDATFKLSGLGTVKVKRTSKE